MAASLDPMSMVGDNINELMQTYDQCGGTDTYYSASDDNDNQNQKSNSQSMNMDMDFGGDGGMDIGNLIGGSGEGGGLAEEAISVVAENPEILLAL